MFKSLVARRMLLVGSPLLAMAVVAWVLVGVWGWFVVLVLGGAAMAVRGVTVLRRAHR